MFRDINPNNKTISVVLQTVIKRDGVPIYTIETPRGFMPGEIEQVKQFTSLTDDSPEIVYLNAIWSPEAIAEYQQHLIDIGSF